MAAAQPLVHVFGRRYLPIVDRRDQSAHEKGYTAMAPLHRRCGGHHRSGVFFRLHRKPLGRLARVGLQPLQSQLHGPGLPTLYGAVVFPFRSRDLPGSLFAQTL